MSKLVHSHKNSTILLNLKNKNEFKTAFKKNRIIEFTPKIHYRTLTDN